MDGRQEAAIQIPRISNSVSCQPHLTIGRFSENILLDIPVSWRFFHFRHALNNQVQDTWASSIIENGFPLLPYLVDPASLSFEFWEYPNTYKKAAVIQEEILHYVKLGAFERIPRRP